MRYDVSSEAAAYGDVNWDVDGLLEHREAADGWGAWYVAGTNVPVDAVGEWVLIKTMKANFSTSLASVDRLPNPELPLTNEQKWAALFKLRDMALRFYRFTRRHETRPWAS